MRGVDVVNGNYLSVRIESSSVSNFILNFPTLFLFYKLYSGNKDGDWEPRQALDFQRVTI
jgi:hypothetical protein